MQYAKGKQIFLDSLNIGVLNVQTQINTTGSVIASGPASSLTGSFQGNLNGNATTATTASYTVNAFNAVSSSYSETASYINPSALVTSASYALTASYVKNAITSSYILNAISSSYSSTSLSASYSDTTLSSSYTLTSTSASYAATASNANDFTILGKEVLGGSQTSYATVAFSVNGVNTIFQQTTGSFTSAFFKYTAYKGANARVSEVLAVWNATSITYTDFSTVDIGTTTEVTSSAVIVGNQLQFNINTNSTGWLIKSLATYL